MTALAKRAQRGGSQVPAHGAGAAVTAHGAGAAVTARQAVDALRQDEGGTLYGITELCREFDISLRTIRFYEDKGLLSPRRVNGARVYSKRDRARLALILRSKAIGASLAEIQQYLDLYGNHGEGRRQQLQFVMDKTDASIQELQARRAHIDALLAELRLINGEVRQQLRGAGTL